MLYIIKLWISVLFDMPIWWVVQSFQECLFVRLGEELTGTAAKNKAFKGLKMTSELHAYQVWGRGKSLKRFLRCLERHINRI